MEIGRVVHAELRPPAAWAFVPALLADPLWWYPEPTEAVITVMKLRRVGYEVVRWPIGLWYPPAVELMQLLSHYRASHIGASWSDDGSGIGRPRLLRACHTR